MAMMHLGFIVGVALLAGARPPAVQEPSAQPVAGSATNVWLVSPGKDPFVNIFIVSPRSRGDVTFPRAQGRGTMDRPSDKARPRVVCGMTVVPVSPDADPKMVVTPKADSNVEYKMRVVSPRICLE